MLKYSACNFLLQVRGAMTMSEFCHVDILKPGLLSDVKLTRACNFMAKHRKLLHRHGNII